MVDLDADLQPGERPQEVELMFPARVFNASSNTASVNTTSIALQWDDPGTGDTFTVPVHADFRDVPVESFTSGELRVALPPEDRVIFDDDSAYPVDITLAEGDGVRPSEADWSVLDWSVLDWSVLD